MRKLIVTTVCTLAVTLSGMFGANQIASNIDNTSVEYSYVNTGAQTTNGINDTERSNLLDVTTNQVASTTGETNKTAVLGARSTNTSTKTKVTKSKKAKAKKTNATGVKGSTASYNGIDLSKCKNVSQAIVQLNKSGCNVVDQSDVKNFSSVQDVLSYLNKQQASKSNTTTTKNTGTTTKAPTTTKTTTSGNTTTTTNTTGISGYANQVLQLVNQERAKEGLKALSMTTPLNNAANKRAQETVQSFSHTRPNGTSFSTVLKEFNITYRTAGENLAYGQKTPQEVVTGWMNSPGHRANIMNGNYGKIGIGVVKSSNGVIYWSQLFTN